MRQLNKRPPSQPQRDTQPQTRTELYAWIRELGLAPALELEMVTAIEIVFTRHERLWRDSKEEAVQALSAAFADMMNQVRDELTAKDATVSSIAHHFETLVAELTDKTHRDPRTRLINFDHFTSQLESFLALEKRARCCAVGLVDITGFKWYNDTLGHAAGDRIIERVATLLREQARSDDLLARDLHARLGGDEFCFMIPDLTDCSQAQTIGERFRAAVEHYDWTGEDARLSAQPVRVDVGVACVWLGGLAERRDIAKALSADLLQRADKLMYGAKAERAGRIFIAELTIENGALVEV